MLSRALYSAFLLLFVPATAFAGVCERPRQVKVVFDGSSGLGLVVHGADRCPPPPACAAKERPVKDATRAPVAVDIRAGTKVLFSATVGGCDDPKCGFSSSAACSGGLDSHRSPRGIVKLKYGRDGRVSVTTRIRAPMQDFPDVDGPVLVTVRDAAGYAAEATYSQCKVRREKSNAAMVCR